MATDYDRLNWRLPGDPDDDLPVRTCAFCHDEIGPSDPGICPLCEQELRSEMQPPEEAYVDPPQLHAEVVKLIDALTQRVADIAVTGEARPPRKMAPMKKPAVAPAKKKEQA